MPPLARADAIYCSTRCRVAAHRARHGLPLELRQVPRWVRHRNKVPLQITGRAASTTSPPTWCSYQAAKSSAVGDGLGFVLNGDGLGCIDLDHCIKADGQLTPLAQWLLGALPATYTEVSPSGTGLHIWGHIPAGLTVVRPGIEVYTLKRYITITGRRWADCPNTLADLSRVRDLLP